MLSPVHVFEFAFSIRDHRDAALGFFHFCHPKSLHSRLALSLELIRGHTDLTGVFHHAKAFLTLSLLGFDGLFGDDAEAFLALLDFLLIELLGHDSKSLRPLQLLPLLLFNQLKGLNRRCSPLYAWDFTLTTSEAGKAKLFTLLLRELAHLLHLLLNTGLFGHTP